MRPRIVDLGHTLSEGDPTWDGARGFSRSTLETIPRDGFFTGCFTADEHAGTHVDAPAHSVAGGRTVDALEADRLVRPAVCLHIEQQVAAHEDYALTRADIEAFEQAHGAISEGALVLVSTGWYRRWTDAARYINIRTGVRHFPGLSHAAAALLARDRRVAGIGIDTPSVDPGVSTLFEVHRVTQSFGVYHIENLARLDDLPPTGFTVVVAPIKIRGGSGGPARVFAIIP